MSSDGGVTPSGAPGPDEYYYYKHIHRIVISCLICVIVAVGIIGNTYVIVAVVLSRKLQTKTNAFVVNLSASDLLSCAVLLFNVYTKLHEGSDGPPLPDWLCLVVSLTTFIGIGACFVSLMLIGINRYFKIARPTKFDRVFTPRSIALMIVGSWLYPVILICVTISIDSNFGFGYSEKYRVCTRKDKSKENFFVSTLGDALLVLPTFIITLVAYALIYAHIKQHTSRRLAAILRRLTHSLRSGNQAVTAITATTPPANAMTSLGDAEATLGNPPHALDGPTTASISQIDRKEVREMDHQQEGMDERNSSHQNNLHQQPRQHENNFAQLQTEQSRARIRKDQMEITKSLFIIVCIHILLITPFAVVIVTPNSDFILPWVFTLFVATPATNPFVYGWKHPHFRAVFKAMLLCRFSQIPEPSKVARRLVGQLE